MINPQSIVRKTIPGKTQKILWSSLLLSLAVFTAHAGDDGANDALHLNATMTRIGNTVTELFPVFLNEARFTNPENEAGINEGVDRIVSLLKTAAPHFNRRAKPSQISYEILYENLLETQRAMRAGNKHYAQNLLLDVVSICTSCHTQDDKQRTLFRGKGRDAFTSDFEYAEFSFLTRNYEPAIEYYDRYLKAPYDMKPERAVVTSANKLLTIYTQVLNDPGRGAAHFKSLAQSGRLPPLVEKNAEEWVKGLEELRANKASQVKKTGFAELEKYVHQYLGPLDSPGSQIVPAKKQTVYHLWLQGLLYRYFAANPSGENAPLLLYWLSINDRATHYSYYYSLADLYLKECMLKHTRHPMARQCFQEYNEYVTFSYSGSMGTNIPEDVQRELKRLRDIVYGGEARETH